MGRRKPNKPKRDRRWSEMVAQMLNQKCPDCISDITIRRLPDGATMIKLVHASTCPYWGAKAAAAGIDRHRDHIVHAAITTD